MTTKLRKKKKHHPAEEKVSIQARVPAYVNAALDSYIFAFLRDNPHASMSKSRLAASLLTKFAKDSGALDESAY